MSGEYLYSWCIKETWEIDRVNEYLKKELQVDYVIAYEGKSYKKHEGSVYYRWNFTGAELRMVNFLLREVYSESPGRDADMLTWKLGDIVYYKPKDLL